MIIIQRYLQKLTVTADASSTPLSRQLAVTILRLDQQLVNEVLLLARGPREYAQRIVDLLTFIPDFRAELVENAANGDLMFLRWVARGTGPHGRFEAVGVDRLIVPNGYVAENLILSDHPIFAAVAKHVGDLPT